MTLVLPLVMMVLFCALYAGVYIWMRRPTFGEAKEHQEDDDVNRDGFAGD